MHTNLLWGLSTPWQRSVCSSQAKLLIQDKLESEFNALKLRAIRRLDESALWRSTDSDNGPLDPKLIKDVAANPCPQDVKFLKRYIAKCTPNALKFKMARKRALQKEFMPSELPKNQIIDEDKIVEILKLRSEKAKKEMQKLTRSEEREKSKKRKVREQAQNLSLKS